MGVSSSTIILYDEIKEDSRYIPQTLQTERAYYIK